MNFFQLLIEYDKNRKLFEIISKGLSYMGVMIF